MGLEVAMKILITGATGFIGRPLCKALRDSGFNLRAAVRLRDNKLPIDCEIVEIGDIDSNTDWQKALAGVDTVIHLAGRTRVANDKVDYSLTDFRKVNLLGTERLARMAAEAGVKRFIFISSAKVNGQGSNLPYTEKDAPQPQDAYSISTREAEDALVCLATQTGLETVILRLPLVYGLGVEANFKNLIKSVGAGLPLPFKGIHNQRSFIYLGNLVDAIIICATHPLAVGETFMLSDGQDISTPDLIKMIACAMNKKLVLFSLHPCVLKSLCRIAGRSEELEKLTGTLLVDSSKIRNLLGWKPPFTLEEGIKETVRGIC